MVLALFGFGHTSLLKSKNETRRTENIEDAFFFRLKLETERNSVPNREYCQGSHLGWEKFYFWVF